MRIPVLGVFFKILVPVVRFLRLPSIVLVGVRNQVDREKIAKKEPFHVPKNRTIPHPKTHVMIVTQPKQRPDLQIRRNLLLIQRLHQRLHQRQLQPQPMILVQSWASQRMVARIRGATNVINGFL